ncbi:MAG: hypothetical protein JXL84_04565 [Deltaproteobacteria bacterium]|nr:hypothetical protein [Deltaproteobacteria bacterium]
MKEKDLKHVKYIGASRLKFLGDFGIKTLEQLNETSIEKLAQVPTIGRHYAKLIKNAASAARGAKRDGTSAESATDGKKKTEKTKEISIIELDVLRKRLGALFEKLTPPEKKKTLVLFDELKKRSDTLLSRLDKLAQVEDGLSKKSLKKMIKKAGVLNAKLKDVEEKLKKKKIEKLALEIQSFSRMLKKRRPLK